MSDRMDYSVLMSVYAKEKSEYLKESMQSIFAQTIPTDDFVLVCDGPLTDDLDHVIEEFQASHPELQVVRLEKNSGLGNALNVGMNHCRHSIIARMDSDDVSIPERCEMQLAAMMRRPNCGVISGTVIEFCDVVNNRVGWRKLPENNKEILAFSRKRNPFNHPAVMLKKESVIAAGGYQETFPLFEDYYLWIRMLQRGNEGYNIPQPILYMRTPPDLYMRRGGKKYAQNMLRFHRWLLSTGWARWTDYLTGALPHAAVCVVPNCVRGFIYRRLHRQ